MSETTETPDTPRTMRAMVLEAPGEDLVEKEVPVPSPAAREVLVEVAACGVCRTDLHVVDGDLDEPELPLILGHQIVGRVVAAGDEVDAVAVGDRIGVPWLGSTCGRCRFCAMGRENLCDDPVFTGYQKDGGFAEYAVADARFSFPIPDAYDDVEAAPLLCAGLIGYRSLRMAGDADVARRVGLYGFGAAAHLLAQICLHQGREVYAFTRPGDDAGQAFALRLGATWAGGSDQAPPVELDAALIFAPVGPLVPEALRRVRKGGDVICAGIHMSEIPAFPYEILWGERTIRSVANLERRDGIEFFDVAPEVPVKTEVTSFALEDANEALRRLRDGEIEGAAVVTI